MNIIETERLVISYLAEKDAQFIIELVNTPEWIQFIGDRNIHNTEDALNYINNGPRKSYEQNGFGLSLVKLKNDGTPIGMCGLIKRDFLEHADIGFAFLPAWFGKGYGFEAAAAIIQQGMDELKFNRIDAITVPENTGSIALLKKLGMTFRQMVKYPGEDEELMLFAVEKHA